MKSPLSVICIYRYYTHPNEYAVCCSTILTYVSTYVLECVKRRYRDLLVFISIHLLETSFHKITYIVSRDYICIDVIYVRRRT